MMKQVTTIGVDLAKNVFQVCVLGPSGQVKLNSQVKRKQLLNTLQQYPALAIAEAARRPKVHGVSIKSIEQQDVQTLLRIRSRHKSMNACPPLLVHLY